MKIFELEFNQALQSFTDKSGYERSVSKTGSFKKCIPMSSLSGSSILLDSSNSITVQSLPIGVRSFEYESYSLSFYFKSGSTYQSVEQNILYNSSNGLGIVFKNGNIIFRVTDSLDKIYECIYKLPYIGSSYYISASYSKGIMALAVNGQEVSVVSVDSDFLFKATSNVNLSSSITTSHVILDSLSVWNKKLSGAEIQEEVEISSYQQNMAQICAKDNPVYFSLERSKKPIEYGFSYKTNKSFNQATLSDLEINSYGLVTLVGNQGSSTGYLKDSYFFPPLSNPGNNQIDWYSDAGSVTVEYSLDDITYSPVSNHSNIPGFQGGLIYFKVTLESSDLEKDRPFLSNLSFVCYTDNKAYSSNSMYYIDSDFDYILMGETLIPISHSYYSGIKTISGGFKTNYSNTRSVELMFLPTSLAENFLLDCGTSYYSWSGAGAISKSGISEIWVNGINVSNETDISSVLTAGIWHHILIKLSSLQTAEAYFNQSQDGLTVGPDNIYTNLALYESLITESPLDRYGAIVNRSYEIARQETLTLEEEGFSSFRVEKVVVSTQ